MGAFVGTARTWAVLGGQAGSEGKGKVAGLFAFEEKPDIAVCAFGPNAGHTAYSPGGVKHVVHQVPMAAINPDVRLAIGPGAAIDPERLRTEIDKYALDTDRLIIDPRAVVITSIHKAYEAGGLERISSTAQGVGAAISDRVLRKEGITMADNSEFAEFVRPVGPHLRRMYNAGARIQFEASQGYDLDLLHGLAYPYCTSRAITADGLANDCAFPSRLIERRIGVFRTYPIRVGNVERDGKQVGWSGPLPNDSVELFWPDITDLAGSPEPLIEHTTTTGKVRRIFTWSAERFEASMWANQFSNIWLNFADYVDWRFHGLGPKSAVPAEAREVLRRWFLDYYKVVDRAGWPLDAVMGMGTGPEHDHYLPERGWL